jgi:hypothetical protein
MAHIALRPEFRAAGAEVNDIEIDGKYAGTMTLTYREGDRLIGAIQLDKTTLSGREKEKVSDWTDEYVHSLADALRVTECEVLVTFGKFDHIVTAYEDELYEEAFDDQRLDDIDPGGQDEYIMLDEEDDEADIIPVHMELVIVGEQDNKVEYHIYGENKQWKAEAFFTIEDTDVHGEVNWMINPSEDEIEAAADLIISDFDEEEIDSFSIEMKHKGELIETYELTHEDLMDEDEIELQSLLKRNHKNSKQYTVVLVRDDADTLTYDIYEQTQGGLPVGRATIDISQRQLAGLIDFRQPTASVDRELMAAALLRELDKEKDYDSVNITMMHQNSRIEDIYFESEHVH